MVGWGQCLCAPLRRTSVSREERTSPGMDWLFDPVCQNMHSYTVHGIYEPKICHARSDNYTYNFQVQQKVLFPFPPSFFKETECI